MRKYATIIGTRNPCKEEILKLKEKAEELHNRGYFLRSGGAKGCDETIEHLENIEVFLPWNGFNGKFHDGKKFFALEKMGFSKELEDVVRKIHPNFKSLNHTTLKFHERNIFQIIGKDGFNENKILSEVVFFVADEKNGMVQGGTATAVKIARIKKIKTVNLRYFK